MKRQPAPKTLTAQRLVLTAPDGSPRIELFVAQNGTPHVHLLDDTGAVRVELGVGAETDDVGDICWVSRLRLRDGMGTVSGDALTNSDGVDITVGVNHLSVLAGIGGVHVVDYDLDGLDLLAGVQRRAVAEDVTRRRSGGAA